MHHTLLLFTLVAAAFGQAVPSIANITNAAIPAMDQNFPVRLMPRSMATIFGSNLSSATASTAPPWATTLGGIEVHLVPLYVGCGTSTAPANCDITANLLFVSPTQINFLVPDTLPSAYGRQQFFLDTVIVENGQRYDTGFSFYLSTAGDFAVFQVGYDCDFSLSLAQPQGCGYSQTPGANSVPIGAVTDVSGTLVTSNNPIHQGQVVILWGTGLGSMPVNQGTGLRQQNNATPLTFGIAQSNTAGGLNVFNLNWSSQTPVWAGESPQYVGLDQINVALPTCTGAVATTEERYNVTMTFTAHDYNSGYVGNGSASLYLPLIISPGEATCQFGATTTTTIVSSANPYDGTQTLVFYVAVSPSSTTGTITLLDGQNILLIGNVVAGSASLPAIPNGPGNHLIKAVYSGNGTFAGSSGTMNESIKKPTVAPTTTTVVSSVNPSVAGQPMTFTATVSPCCLPTGSVTFSVGNLRLGCGGSLSQGKSTCQAVGFEPISGPSTSLGVGAYSITATYNGDGNYASSSSAIVNQVVQPNKSTVSLTAWTYRGGTGASEAALREQVSFSAGVGPNVGLVPTGNITFFDGATVLGTTSAVSAGLTTFDLALGTHSIKASYSGDINFGPATSSTSTVTIWTISSFASSPNPSSSGQTIVFNLCGIPSNVTSGYVMFMMDGGSSPVRITSPCTSATSKSLVSGQHLVTVGLVDIVDRKVPTVLFPVSITQTVN